MKIQLLSLLSIIAFGQKIDAMQNQQVQRNLNKCALVSQGILKTTVGLPLVVLGSALAISGPIALATTSTIVEHNDNPMVAFTKVMMSGTLIMATPITAPLGAWAAVKGTQLTRSGCKNISDAINTKYE